MHLFEQQCPATGGPLVHTISIHSALGAPTASHPTPARNSENINAANPMAHHPFCPLCGNRICLYRFVLTDLYRLLPPEGVKILLVLFLAFLTGLEREERHVRTGQFSFGGVRTYPLIGLIAYGI